MNPFIKSEVENHILAASKLNRNDERYRAIKHLFRVDQLDFMFFHKELALDIRRGLKILGLECDVSSSKVKLHEDAILKYYESVMGLKAEKIEDKSYYERMNIDVKE